MKLLSLNAKKLTLAASAVAVVAGLAMPSQARVMSAAEFLASIDEAKYICKRLDEPFWMMKRQYGCGDQITCRSSGKCQIVTKKRRPNDPPVGIVARVLPPIEAGSPEGNGPKEHEDHSGKKSGPNDPHSHF